MTLDEILKYYNLNDYSYTFGTDKETVHCYVSKIYEDIFSQYQNKEIKLLEIGVFKSASLKLWSEYFSNAKIIGVDIQDNILPQYKNLKNVQTIFGDAYQDNFVLNDDKYDIIIDDGPHTLESQLIFINKYISMLNKNGVMIIEDIANISYMPFLLKQVPSNFTTQVYDLRTEKNRYDDIVLVIKN